jgi:hypothetical protein
MYDNVISTYTDGQAVDDGFLVEVGGTDRCTRALFNSLMERLPESPPENWPVNLMTWVGGSGTNEAAELRARAAISGLIGTYGRDARRIYDENIGGGIWRSAILERNGEIFSLHVSQGDDLPVFADPVEHQTLWILPV